MKSLFVILMCFCLVQAGFAKEQLKTSHPELRAELLEMSRVDQKARKRSLIDFDEVMKIDKKNTERLIAIVAEHGWPTISMVYEDGARAAWLLVQHADQNPEFQKTVLKLMEKLLDTNEVHRSNYAYLYDRTHTPQLYGTQGECKGSGVWVPREIEDPENVDKRRAEMEIHIGSLEEYTNLMH